MTIDSWTRDTLNRIRKRPVDGMKESIYQFYYGIHRRVGKSVNFGNSFWDEEWDILVILDACRYDMMEEVKEKYGFSNRPFISNASASIEWMEKNFKPKYEDRMKETAYITANPHSKEIEKDDFLYMEELWKSSWNSDFGSVPPRPVTDACIECYRDLNPDKMIVHYMQPHHPFRNGELLDAPASRDIDSKSSKESLFDETPWGKIRRGEIEKDHLMENYLDNLEYVLSEIDILKENLDGKMVLTADHGNAIGELGLYGHIMYSLSPVTKKVPWVEIEAKSNGSHKTEEHNGDSVSPEERLRNLGYL